MNVFAIHLCLALLFVFDGYVISENFCEAFREHQNSISYIFRQTLRAKPALVGEDAKVNKHHIIIDGKYWNLAFVKKDSTVKLDANQSFLAPHFTDDFFEAACLSKGQSDTLTFQILLFKRNTKDKVYVTEVPNNKYNYTRDLSDFSEPKEFALTGQTLPEFAFAYREIAGWGNRGIDLAMGSSKTKFIKKRLSFKLTDATTFALEISEISNEYKDITETKDVIGIGYQYSEGKNGLLILLKKDQKIYWCWRGPDEESCKEKLLIDCTGPVPSVPAVPPVPNQSSPDSPQTVSTLAQESGGGGPEEKKFPFWIVLVIAVIVIIVIVAIVLFFVFSKKTAANPSAEEAKPDEAKDKSKSESSNPSQDNFSKVFTAKTNRSSIASKPPTTPSNAKPSKTGSTKA